MVCIIRFWCIDQTGFISPKTSGSRFYIADDIKWNTKSKDILRRVTDPVYGAIAVFLIVIALAIANCKGMLVFYMASYLMERWQYLAGIKAIN
jgi:hypothetical protein